MVPSLKLTSSQEAAIHIATICQLARDARAERNVAVLEFLGHYLTPLLPPVCLQAFREELRAIPARKVHDTDGELLAAIKAEPAKPAPKPAQPKPAQPKPEAQPVEQGVIEF